MSTAPREPKNGHTRAAITSAPRNQRWVEGRVRKLLVLSDISCFCGRERHMALICSLNSTRRNIRNAAAKITSTVVVLAPTTARLIPTMSSLSPRIG